MPQINRRTLLAGAAATTALTAGAHVAAQDAVEVRPNIASKSILITGCSTGFGRLAAEHYAREGARVFATMRDLPRAEGAELTALAAAENWDLHLIEIDVLSDDQVSSGVAKAMEINGGPIDVLINNAGISFGGPVEIQDIEATQLTFDTNVFGAQRMIRAVLPSMREARSGLIINITSQLGRVIAPSYGMYSPSKFALEALSEGLAYELVPHGVDVTIVEPGGYPTMIWSNANTNSVALLERSDDTHTSGYPALVSRLGQRTGGGSTDPMDVPRAMADIIAQPPGTRPLRVPVHPGGKPQIAINTLTAQVQVDWLGASPFGPWIKDVHNV
ncbi:SDR family NAD(P)-dependent oxidoreductase [Erythrobacter sp. Alg231-14]|uniref:SDR family NAD(P)-dependent oxidoreductase n=1 Tax=Erythrobacter sp. Alg231-14 TaxID=1922225 RepID=UPI000D55E96B